MYINDLPNEVESSIKFLADNTKVYREIHDVENDTLSLQSDLDHMSNWANTWQLRFNPDKCEVMRITHKWDSSEPMYHFLGKTLKVINQFKDLDIIMTNNLAWSKQVNTAVNKANRLLDLVKRTVGKKFLQNF